MINAIQLILPGSIKKRFSLKKEYLKQQYKLMSDAKKEVFNISVHVVVVVVGRQQKRIQIKS